MNRTTRVAPVALSIAAAFCPYPSIAHEPGSIVAQDFRSPCITTC